MSLLNEWRKWDSGGFPYVLDTDANVLESPRSLSEDSFLETKTAMQ